MDWWGNSCGADTEKEDEARYQYMLWLLNRPIEVVDAEHAAWDSAVNGGTGIFTIRGIE